MMRAVRGFWVSGSVTRMRNVPPGATCKWRSGPLPGMNRTGVLVSDDPRVAYHSPTVFGTLNAK